MGVRWVDGALGCYNARVAKKHTNYSKGRKCPSKRKDGQPCQNPAGAGTDHPGYGTCSNHWGCTKAMRIKGHLEMVRDKSEKACRMLNLDIDYTHIAPETALLEEVRRSYGIVAWFDQQIEDFGWADLIDDEAERTEVAAWYRIYHEERAHLARASKMAIDAGVAVKTLALLEDQAVALARAIQAVLDGLGLDDRQLGLAPTLLRRALTAIPVSSTPTAEELADA